MTASTPLLLPAVAAVLLLAAAGCDADRVSAQDVLPAASVAALEVPPLGQELFRMFEEEKSKAAVSELPAQF